MSNSSIFAQSVDARNQLQHSGLVHPYTCGNDECRKSTNQAPLRAVEYGWICDHCGYTQPHKELVRPDCDNCGIPASYRACHCDAGGAYLCEECCKTLTRDREITQVRQIWPLGQNKIK